MPTDIPSYNTLQSPEDKMICDLLMTEINTHLPEATSKIRHANPVWFLNGNPVVGYSKQKKGICLLFWSGQSFDEDNLHAEGKFKAAQVVYTQNDQVNTIDLARRLDKCKTIQRDYQNIVKRKGLLERLV